MPNPDAREFRVSKQGLDPFGGARQAVREVKRRHEGAARPNTARLSYDVEDNGDHFEVTMTKHGGDAGPSRVADPIGAVGGPGRRGKGNENRQKGREVKGFGATSTRSKKSSGDGDFISVDGPRTDKRDSFDLQSRLDSLYTMTELRDKARRHGVYYGQTTRKEELIDSLIDQEPLFSRRMAGRRQR